MFLISRREIVVCCTKMDAKIVLLGEWQFRKVEYKSVICYVALYKNLLLMQN